jgi:hypothetical protein
MSAGCEQLHRRMAMRTGGRKMDLAMDAIIGCLAKILFAIA